MQGDKRMRSTVSRTISGSGESIKRERVLVGAGVLNVARLLAAIAHTLGRRLGRAVARQVSDFSAYDLVSRTDFD